MASDHVKLKAEGHVVIRDADTKEVLVDQHNDIHLENLSEAIALSLGSFSSGYIEEMWFGSGGSIIDSTGSIDYLPPNTLESRDDADLYNPTYSKVVNDRSSNFSDNSALTNIKTVHTSGTTYTDIVITCTLGYSEPTGQSPYDNATTSDAPYIFDEMGLKTVDTTANKKRLLTHVIFHPVQKSLNRSIELIYTIRISMMS